MAIPSKNLIGRRVRYVKGPTVERGTLVVGSEGTVKDVRGPDLIVCWDNGSDTILRWDVGDRWTVLPKE